jgi:hypothetical protein
VFIISYWRQKTVTESLYYKVLKVIMGGPMLFNCFLTEQLAAICSFEEGKRLTEACQLSDNKYCGFITGRELKI